VLPQWRLPQGIAHAVFASRRGLLPAVRVLIDYLAEKLPPLIEASRLDCQNCPKPGPDTATNSKSAPRPSLPTAHATMR